MKLLIAIHGILQRLTAPGWVDQLDAWASRELRGVKVIKKEYRAGPFPRLNCFWKDPLLAREIAGEVELFFDPPQWPKPVGQPPEVHFVSHSNGAVIALKAIQLLAERGMGTRSAIFVQGAIESDVMRNGVLDLVGGERRRLGRAVAWANAGDEVCHFHGVKRVLGWPYGSLGHDGWTLEGKPYLGNASVFTRLVPTEWGHSGCWAPEHIEDSFQAIKRTVLMS